MASAWERAPSDVKAAIRANFPRPLWGNMAAIAEKESGFRSDARATHEEGLG